MTVDIVICVHNALRDVQKCVKSIYAAQIAYPYRVIVVDDYSAEPTKKFVRDYTTNDKNKILVAHKERRNIGYTKSANLGLKASTADVVILLNSDTIICKATVHKLLESLYSDEKVGIAGPMSNAAGEQSIPTTERTAQNTAINRLPPGVNIEQMDEHCNTWSANHPFPEVNLIHGFCMAIKREVIERLSYFDELLFTHGYGEENDYCFRARAAGFKLVVATHAFVYHEKSKSYSNQEKRSALMAKGIQALTSKYGAELKHTIKELKNNLELRRIRTKAQVLWKPKKRN